MLPRRRFGVGVTGLVAQPSIFSTARRSATEVLEPLITEDAHVVGVTGVPVALDELTDEAEVVGVLGS